ncbi:MAG: PhoH family protein [Elusimicrobia bacterium]|nr:PhoH family protein [Candidatus Liberimonas magnetica]
MVKTFIIDTNVLIHDPNALASFKDNKVIIPMAVIEELDGLKSVSDERGQSARSIIRKLNALRSKGKLSDGVKLDGGGVLKVELDQNVKLPYDFVTSKIDHRIIGIALEIQNKGEKPIFISKDINLRIKAEALGLETQDYEKAKVKVEELYKGWREMTLTSEEIDSFYKNKKLKINGAFFPNEGIVMREANSGSKSALAKYSVKDKLFVPLFHINTIPWGIKPLNMEQRFAIELLLCDDVSLVTLIGVPGAGKTLLSLACGLQKILEENRYRRLLVARPIVPMGKDIGYLPGTKEEKLTSWMGAIYDNLEFLLQGSHPGQKIEDNNVEYFTQTGKLEVEALTYIRGRSLPELFIIIDDAQNLTPHEVKTIISRAGTGTKIILTGDPYQIDNPYLDASSNGLTYLVEHFKGQPIFGHLQFIKSERSSLAALASELL